MVMEGKRKEQKIRKNKNQKKLIQSTEIQNVRRIIIIQQVATLKKKNQQGKVTVTKYEEGHTTVKKERKNIVPRWEKNAQKKIRGL